MAGSDDIDLYAILGVSKRSSISDIKKVRVMIAQVVPSDADTLNTFKNRLDKHWLDQDVLYYFYSELTGTGGVSICM